MKILTCENVNLGLSGKKIIAKPLIKLGKPQARRNSRQGLYVTEINGITTLQLWLMMNHAMKGRIKQKEAKITDETIIDRERFLDPRNSPR